MTATLTVTNSTGGSASASVTLLPGNTGPIPVIASPTSADRFSTGQSIALSGSATDASGATIAGSKLSWEVRLHAGSIITQMLPPTKGASSSFVAPEPPATGAESAYLEIRLTATDSSGLSKTTVRKLLPHVVTLDFASDPAGGDLIVSGTAVKAPASVRTWEGAHLSIKALDGVRSSGEALLFRSWSDGGNRAHTVVMPAIDSTITASYAISNAPTFFPVADARVKESSPNTNFGAATSLTVQGGSSRNTSYLRFNVAGIAGSIASAKLFLYASDGTDIGPTLYRATSGWSESSITWANQPGSQGSAITKASLVPTSTWVVFDVTKAVSGNGQIDFLLKGNSSDPLSSPSREAGSRQPRLVITLTGGSDVTPPEVPTGLSADAFSSSVVDLAWTQSGDDVGTVSYDVYRDGRFITTTGPGPAYEDATVRAKTTYSYQVRARDAAGNVSELSAPISVTTPTTTSTAVYTAIQDARVSEASPSATTGRSSILIVQGGDGSHSASYLMFAVPSVGGSVYRAQIRLFVPAGVPNGSTDGPTIYHTKLPMGSRRHHLVQSPVDNWPCDRQGEHGR